MHGQGTSTETPPIEMAASGLAQPGVDTERRMDIADGPTVPALPAWLIDADAEERRELEELGAIAEPTFTDDAQRDALVSRLLRAYHEHEKDVERFDASEQLEHGAITSRYDRLRAPAKRQLVRLHSFLNHLVRGATFIGKKKSRTVGWGSFGHRKDRDKLDLVNVPEIVAALRTIKPAALTVAVTINGAVQTQADKIISLLIDGTLGANGIGGTEVSILSELRAALNAGTVTVGKTEVSHLLKEGKTIPGAVVVIGEEKPWFEVEPLAGTE